MNNSRNFCVIMFLAAIIICSPIAHSKSSNLMWKSSALLPDIVETKDPTTVITSVEDKHIIVQFEDIPKDIDKVNLESSGIKLLRYLGSNSFFAKVSKAKGVSQAVSQTGITSAFDIQVEWKLHPMLLTGEYPQYSVFDSPGESGFLLEDKKTNKSIETIAVYVLFHPDVDLEVDGVNTIKQYGGIVRSQMRSINGVVAWIPLDNLDNLASDDSVQWIEPPLPPLDEVNDSNRVITQVNQVQSSPYNLDGSGVVVLVYDGGSARASHVDFGGRLTVRDSSSLSDHSTHVAGTVGGDGTASGGTYKGMAPAVTIQSYGFEYDGSGTFLYTNPGDLEDDYDEAINTYGVEISNNSIGTNVDYNGFPCEWEGDYGATSMLIDEIVRGSLGDPMRIIWANGNERGYTRCGTGYLSTAPPACAKNHITIGALNSNNDSMTTFSSWGPTDDGRMKPDVSGPGSQSNDDGGVTSTSSSSDTAYTTKSGTSMAAPTVTGICALILQDWKAQFPGDPLPRNSMLKVLLAHNAADLGNPGPDYQFGYGSVRAKDTIDYIRTENFVDESLNHGETQTFFIYVSPGDPFLKATLAWDDPPGAVNTIPELVNDIDITVKSATGAAYYPWTLDPANGGDPAVQSQADHANNIEQVYIDNPASGTWIVEVNGYSIPQGPQPFSLAVSPSLINCSSQGKIFLDSAKYTCSSTPSIMVNDCDLNINPTVIDSVTVAIASTSEPTAENVLLTETEISTAIFTGTIELSETDAPGILLITDSDIISVTYNDADDGSGSPAISFATATIDCQPPIISNVQTTDITHNSARVTFNTNEPSTGQVQYGLVCVGTDIAQTELLSTTHSITINGLSNGQEYFFEVYAWDEGGNLTTDDNAGNCYSFTTLELPDYYTEIFTLGDNDLTNQVLNFIPNGSPSYYSCCREETLSFLTDPTGGTTLSLSDDGYTMVTLSGGEEVFLYGTGYSSFYICANGYITFNSGIALTLKVCQRIFHDHAYQLFLMI